MSGHTPGPLVASRALRPDNVGGWDWCVREPGGIIVGEAFERVDHGASRPAEANARLWAAAPDLYEALERTLWLAEKWTESSGRSSPDHEIVAEARAALAKAVAP